MKCRCIHGYFIFNETKVGQISDFISLTGLPLVARDDYYTFETIAAAPNYSIKGAPLLGITATETFTGNPWDVFRENGFVYDFGDDVVRPIALTTAKTTVRLAGNRFVSPGLLLPGSVTPDGRIEGFSGWFSRDRLTWLYSEVSYV